MYYKNGIFYTVKSDFWNNGYEDAMMGYDKDEDYLQELECKQDIQDYLDGYLCAIDSQD